jgi:hypothetical protein
MDDIRVRLERIEAALVVLARRQATQEYYSTDEVARLLRRDPFTVREWCRKGRVHAKKRLSGRGKFTAWAISHEELLRIQREGLLPFGR